MSNSSAVIDQCIALAGLAQAVRIVQHLAWKGQTNPTDFKAVIASILRVDAPSAAAVYGGSFEVSSGLRILNHQIDPQHSDKDPEFVNLIINIMSVQQQLQNNKTLTAKLGQLITNLSTKYSDLEFYNNEQMFDTLIEECSDAYKQTVSQLTNRIQVKGEPKYLQQPQLQSQVRAALLAAVRACFLWRQSGGSRWHFLFRKKVLLSGINQLVNNPIRE